MDSLFTDSQAQKALTPLAERMRPRNLGEVAGQADVVAVLREIIQKTALPSLILWGPPGCGKTTIARLLAGERYYFEPTSAVSVGVKEVRAVVEEARVRRSTENQGTLLFLDEIHRFNKAQQDALLPHVEAGTIVLVGATTENPSFEVNSALLSRCRVLVLEALEDTDIEGLLQRALADEEYGLGLENDSAEPGVLLQIAQLAAGDARFALNTLEVCAGLVGDSEQQITSETLKKALAGRSLMYDKGGDEHFNAISALHKAVRGSDPDAALYWIARMLEGGEDPKYVARRMIRMASEDIGLADPWALVHATSVKDAVEFLGLPECNNALAQLAVYLSCAPKSNAVYTAYKAARDVVNKHGALPAPLNIRNAPTGLMKDLGYGEGYTYGHNYEGGFYPDNYWPDKLKDNPPRLLNLKGIGAEKTLADRLHHWWGSRFDGNSEESIPGQVAQAAVPAEKDESQAQRPDSGGEKPDSVKGGASVPLAETDSSEATGLKISKRRLPHWELEGSTYFITWRLVDGLKSLSDLERDMVQAAILHFKGERYHLHAWVVMDDHVHVVCRPFEGHSISQLLHSWKSYTAHKITEQRKTQGQIWQHENWDRIIREESDLIEKCQYILNNPVKRWPGMSEYKWVGFE